MLQSQQKQYFVNKKVNLNHLKFPAFLRQKNFKAISCFLTSANYYFCDLLEKPGE